MEKHLATIEYIKDILEEYDLDITFKKGKYVIKFIFDAKNSVTIDAIAKLRAIGKKNNAESKLSIYFPKGLFKIQLETINPPKPKLMVTDTFSPNLYKRLINEGVIYRTTTANTNSNRLYSTLNVMSTTDPIIIHTPNSL